MGWNRAFQNAREAGLFHRQSRKHRRFAANVRAMSQGEIGERTGAFQADHARANSSKRKGDAVKIGPGTALFRGTSFCRRRGWTMSG